METLIDCACGCGCKLTPTDKRGRPHRFLGGHWARLQPNKWTEVKCEFCGKSLIREAWHIRKVKHHFCDKVCEGKWSTREGRRRGANNGHYNTITVACAGCGKDVTKAYSLIMRRRNRVYCPDCIPTHLRHGRPGFYVGYPREFSAALRHRIRRRDKFTCQECGKHQGEVATLHVHHIDYDKQHNDPINLIALCPSCHTQTNFATDVWQSKFQAFMASRFASAAA